MARELPLSPLTAVVTLLLASAPAASVSAPSPGPRPAAAAPRIQAVHPVAEPAAKPPSQTPAAAPTSVAPAAWTLNGRSCQLVSVPTAAPFGVLENCPGIRPGAVVTSSVGLCSYNFMFKGSDGNTYMGTAGHCILDGTNVQEATWPSNGPVAKNADGVPIGRFAFAVLNDTLDFALIRLNPDALASSSPQGCHFGGPVGINTDQPGLGVPVLLQQYGAGLLFGTVVPARTMVAFGMPDPNEVTAIGAVTPGDSGSGVITPDGRAVGYVVAVGVGLGSPGTGGLDSGNVIIMRLVPEVAEAQHATNLTFTLATAPLL